MDPKPTTTNMECDAKEENTVSELKNEGNTNAESDRSDTHGKQAENPPSANDKSIEAATTKKESKGSGAKNDGSVGKETERADPHSLQVKNEFILDQRPACLDPLPEVSQAEKESRRNEDRNKRKKKKGMNKKRPRDARIDDTEKLCLYVIRGETCPHGEGCRYTHDLKEYLANRPPDLTQLPDGCPIYRLRGYCEYGVGCRFGSSHVNMSTGENIKSPGVEPPPSVKNHVSKDVQISLRKKKYPFKCKRFNEQGASDFTTPVPHKERKTIDFSNKVYVAPLTTVGNLPFRRIMKHFGADITCGEMAVATCLLEGRSSEWALLKRHPCEDVFGVQLAGGYPDQFARVSELIENEGINVDFVDLNLGCPLDLICNKGAGAGLMMREKRLRQSLIGITNTLSCPVTIKMRTGWDEHKPFAHELVRKIQSWGVPGVSAIMIHGRSRLQRYQKAANWEYISKVAMIQNDDTDKIPVVGNGDVFSYSDYEEKMKTEGVSATAMLGRGALIKPWLPTEIKERRYWDISASERLDILKDFVKFGLEHWGSDQKGVNTTRRFLLEWLSFLYRYVPVGLLEVKPQRLNQRPPSHMCGRNDLETLFLSKNSYDWIKISEMLLGPVPEGFEFEPKHKANGYK